MNFELFSLQRFLIFTVSSTLILQETKQKGILVNRTLGDCVHLDLENRKINTSNHEVTWKKGQILVGKMKRSGSTCAKSNAFNERCQVFDNGSLSLCPTFMNDTGHYTAEIYNKNGINLQSQTVQLVLTQPKPELEPEPEPEPEPKRKTNISHLLFFISIGAHGAIFLIVLLSSVYYFGKRKRQQVHWETGRNTVEYAAIFRCKQDQRSPVLYRPQAVETTEEGQLSEIRNQEDTITTAAESSGGESLNISTFQVKWN